MPTWYADSLAMRELWKQFQMAYLDLATTQLPFGWMMLSAMAVRPPSPSALNLNLEYTTADILKMLESDVMVSALYVMGYIHREFVVKIVHKCITLLWYMAVILLFLLWKM